MKETHLQKHSYIKQTEDGAEYSRSHAYMKAQNSSEPSKLVPGDTTASIAEPVVLPPSVIKTASSQGSMSVPAQGAVVSTPETKRAVEETPNRQGIKTFNS